MSRRKYPCQLKIYLLKNNVDDNIYAGSTKQTEKARMTRHYNDYMAGTKTSSLHKHIQEIGWSHFYMTVIDTFDCPDAKYAGEAENTAIQIWGNLNDRIAWIDPDEKEEYDREWHKKYNQSEHGKVTRTKYAQTDSGKKAISKAKKWYDALPVIQCDFCTGRWKLTKDKNKHEKTQKHLDGVAAFDKESHRLAKEVLAMYL